MPESVRLQAVPAAGSRPGNSPREKTAIEIAINVASQREGRRGDGAVALEADCVIGWHSEVVGHTKAILKSRPETHAREQGIGLRPLTLGDLCEAAVAGGREGRAAVRAALAPLIAAAEAVPAPGQGVPEALAIYVREHSDVTRAYLSGGSPQEILRELSEAVGATDAVRAAVLAAGKDPR